jgi:hypothetical protein
VELPTSDKINFGGCALTPPANHILASHPHKSMRPWPM